MTDSNRPNWGQPTPGKPPARTRPKLEGKARSDAIKGCGCFTVVIAGVVIGAAVLLSGGSSKPTFKVTATTLSGATGLAIDPSARPPALTATAPAAASIPPPATTIAAWYQDGGKSWIATLSEDIASVTADSRSGDSGALNADCMQLSADDGLAQSYASAPNTWAQLSWSSALTTLHQGWWNCNGGFSDNSTSEVGNAVAEIESAGPLLTATTQRVHQAGG